MNVELPGFSQGQQWPYNEAPAPVKKWLENKSILFETTICSIVEYDATNSISEEVVYDEEAVKADSNKNNILFRKFDTTETKEAEESGIIVKEKKKKKAKKKAKKYISKAPTCKGVKSDGYPCKTTKLTENGYCRHHKDQENIQN